jgi:hypothetical protein
MLKCFGNLIGETVKAYMDDIVVKFKNIDQLMINLKKPSRSSEGMAQNSTLKNVFLGSQEVCYSDSSSLSAASKPT